MRHAELLFLARELLLTEREDVQSLRVCSAASRSLSLPSTTSVCMFTCYSSHSLALSSLWRSRFVSCDGHALTRTHSHTHSHTHAHSHTVFLSLSLSLFLSLSLCFSPTWTHATTLTDPTLCHMPPPCVSTPPQYISWWKHRCVRYHQCCVLEPTATHWAQLQEFGARTRADLELAPQASVASLASTRSHGEEQQTTPGAETTTVDVTTSSTSSSSSVKSATTEKRDRKAEAEEERSVGRFTQARFLLEEGLAANHTQFVGLARDSFRTARQETGLWFRLTGVMGSTLQYQTVDKAQLTVEARSRFLSHTSQSTGTVCAICVYLSLSLARSPAVVLRSRVTCTRSRCTSSCVAFLRVCVFLHVLSLSLSPPRSATVRVYMFLLRAFFLSTVDFFVVVVELVSLVVLLVRFLILVLACF
jgi:hypothetical protein